MLTDELVKMSGLEGKWKNAKEIETMSNSKEVDRAGGILQYCRTNFRSFPLPSFRGPGPEIKWVASGTHARPCSLTIFTPHYRYAQALLGDRA